MALINSLMIGFGVAVVFFIWGELGQLGNRRRDFSRKDGFRSSAALGFIAFVIALMFNLLRERSILTENPRNIVF